MRTGLVVAIPIAVLLVDIVRAPRLFGTQVGTAVTAATEVAENETLHIGRLRGHEVTIGSDSIRSEHFLDCCADGRNAILAGRWKGERGGFRTSPVFRAVRQKLETIDMAARDRMEASLTAPGETGDVDCIEVAPGASTDLPLYGVFVLTVSEGEPLSEAWNVGLPQAYACAAQHGIDRVLIPAVGIDPSLNELPYRDFYRAVFEAAPGGSAPPEIRLSWYPRWDRRNRDAARDALATLQNQTFDPPGGLRTSLENPTLRLACLAFAVCLGSAALRSTRMTPIRWLALVLAYATAFGAAQRLVPMVYADTGDGVFLFTAALTLVLAFLFPVLATVNLGKVFGSGGQRS